VSLLRANNFSGQTMLLLSFHAPIFTIIPSALSLCLQGKPAWGAWAKGDGKFSCSSFELGVLMTSAQGGTEQTQASCAAGSAALCLPSGEWPLPYDVNKAHVSYRVGSGGCCHGGVVSMSA
jgi:hypothetical protein